MISDKHRYDMQTRSNKIFKTIKDFEIMFPDEFKQTGIHKCDHCSGSGFEDKHQMINCSYCGGMGYKGFEQISGHFICRSCNAYGCDNCNCTGIVDWVTHANGSDLMSKGKYI